MGDEFEVLEERVKLDILKIGSFVQKIGREEALLGAKAESAQATYSCGL